MYVTKAYIGHCPNRKMDFSKKTWCHHDRYGYNNGSIPYIRSIKATFINQSKEWWVSCNSENPIRPEKTKGE